MTNIPDIRNKVEKLWAKFDKRKLSHQDARIHIGMARTILDTHKVEIAAAHLALANIVPEPKQKVLNGAAALRQLTPRAARG